MIDSLEFAPPPEDVSTDPLRATSMLRNPEFEAEVTRWVERWTEMPAPWLAREFERMGSHVAEVDSMLKARDLPRSLRYLPIVESGYNPRAVSPARAVGLWQLMEGTARDLDVRVSPLIDERMHPGRSTEAALDFLEQLHDDFGSWFLALAAYNAGPARVRGILRRHAPLEPRSDALFWKIRPYLPRETRDFVPKLFAAIRIAERPENFGHSGPSVRPSEYEEIEISDQATLDVVARAAGVTQEEIERLNPHIVRGLTPPQATVRLRVPAGTGARFRARFAEIPPEERVTFLEHRVAEGETLSHIAVRYGVPLADLRAANPSVRDRYLRVGRLLTVPVAPSVRAGGMD
ncbi:MAG: transglycosylase SLT domain-containing protein [Gemmatimonadota bacterium]|nr:transglycosylase SLT domain-containing protein [Gemmatimonadota bacterium]